MTRLSEQDFAVLRQVKEKCRQCKYALVVWTTTPCCTCKHGASDKSITNDEFKQYHWEMEIKPPTKYEMLELRIQELEQQVVRITKYFMEVYKNND